MLDFILGLLLAMLAIIFWTLLRTYQHTPERELKRLARHGDDVAELLYRAVAYGVSLNVLLGGAAIIAGAVSLAIFTLATSIWWALIIVLAFAGLGVFIFVPSGDLSRGSLWLAKRAAPSIAWILERLGPIIDWCVRCIRAHRRIYVHTGLYEKSDLFDLLERQKGQPDSRIPEAEVDLLQHALTFGDTLVVDALVPQRVVKMIAASEPVGPVLMDELNRSGFSKFPVYEGHRDNVVGILHLRDLVGARKGGTVADVMHRNLTYVHEDFTLYQALQAFLKTKRHLFLVVNSFEELVGIITIEDVLEQVIGHPIMDEFDKYDDMRAVAASLAKQEHDEHKKSDAEPEEPTPDAKEMVK